MAIVRISVCLNFIRPATILDDFARTGSTQCCMLLIGRVDKMHTPPLDVRASRAAVKLHLLTSWEGVPIPGNYYMNGFSKLLQGGPRIQLKVE